MISLEASMTLQVTHEYENAPHLFSEQIRVVPDNTLIDRQQSRTLTHQTVVHLIDHPGNIDAARPCNE